MFECGCMVMVTINIESIGLGSGAIGAVVETTYTAWSGRNITWCLVRFNDNLEVWLATDELRTLEPKEEYQAMFALAGGNLQPSRIIY